ncbi:MAG TPA: ornithine cyclodeaminase family protein [Chloroflexota bacterium]|nr:ornithine cyclodeaminase family protein [Chloroflexota bacterium]
MPLLLSETDVRALLTVSKAIDLLGEAFRLQGEGKAENDPRQRLSYPHGVLNYMAAAIPQARVVGLKAYPATASGATFAVLLFDSESGELLAMMQADWLGRIRTGAASGLATRYLANADARVAGVIGAGGQSETQIEAIASVRRLELIKVFSPTRERRLGLVRRLRGRMEARIEAVESAEEAVRESDVVAAITTAREPVIRSSWLKPGVHINAAGANRLGHTEVDPSSVRQSTVIAVDDLAQARRESQDLLNASAQGDLDWTRVVELGSIVAGRAPGRGHMDDITLFESQGIALEDMAVARYVYDQAVAAGRGRPIEFGDAE